jgi:cytochrome c2
MPVKRLNARSKRACHTLADSSGNIAGPNLWGVFDRVAGSRPGKAGRPFP